MKIICAGFPKTGTKSMALALRDLGYSVHDFEEHLEENLDNYVNFFEGYTDSKLLMEKYRDVDVVVDQPACTMWNTFFIHYPDAKVILMERESAEVWCESYRKMLEFYLNNHSVWYEGYIAWFSSTRAKLDVLNRHNMCRSAGVIHDYWDMKAVSTENWKNQYTIHNAAVRAIVPPSQLLVFKVGDGWENLCEFLDKQVPEHPFPKENVGGAKGNIVDKFVKFGIQNQIRKEFRRSMLLLGTGLAAATLSVVFFIKRRY